MTVIVVLDAVILNGLPGNKFCVAGSVLSGFAFCKPSGSAPCALGRIVTGKQLQ